MPRYHSDSDSDYSPLRHRSPRRRPPTPGPNPHRARDLSPDDHVYHQHHPRFEYEPHTPFYPVASGAAGPGPARPRSAGPSTDTYTTTTGNTGTTTTTDSTTLARRARNRSRGRRGSLSSSSDYDSAEDDHYRHAGKRPQNNHRRRSSSPSALHKARTLFSHTFTPSTSGLGVGVLGAIVGGLAAREASEAVSQHSSHSHGHERGYGHGHDGRGHRRRGSGSRDKHQHLISTVVGAAVGGLGANAIERRIERAKSGEREGFGDGMRDGGGYREGGRLNREEGGSRWRDEGGRRSGELRRY